MRPFRDKKSSIRVHAEKEFKTVQDHMKELSEKLHNPHAERFKDKFTTVFNKHSKFVLRKDKMKNMLEEKRKMIEEANRIRNQKVDKPDEIEAEINKKYKGK